MTKKVEVVLTAKDETGAAFASARRSLDSLAASGASLRNAFSFLGGVGGLAGMIGGAGLTATVAQTVNDLDKLSESAEQVGVSVESLSALNFAGKLSGLEFEDMTAALTKLSVKMQDSASGNKEASALFADLGVKVTDSTGRLKSADAVLAEVADAFAGFEDGAAKTAVAVDLFGKSGAKLVPLLNQGAAGLADMRKEAESLGAVVSGDLARQAAQFNDNLDRLTIASGAVGKAIAADLLPWLNKLSEEFLAGISAAGGFWGALNAGITLNPFKDTADNLKTVRADMAKMESDLKEYGYIDEQRYTRKKNQLEYLKRLEVQGALADAAGNYGNEGRGLILPKTELKRTPPGEAKPLKSGGAARAASDDAARLLESLREQVTLKETDAASTEKLSAAEQQRAKVLYQLDAGTLKATASQRAAIVSNLDALVGLEKLLAGQEEYRKALEAAEQSNAKGRSTMLEQITAAERAAEVIGLTADQISVVEQARMADAIAIASENGATEEQIAYLEEELALRARLTDALINGRSKELEKKDAEDSIKSVGEIGEFAKQAARDMQTAFADFFFEPTKDGFDSMADNFGKAVQRMIANAASAQLLRTLLGDQFDKTGELGGLAKGAVDWASEFDWGSIFGSLAGAAFANGGIMTSTGPLPLNKYATGGIANRPQVALFGEGSTPEAYVPLPDGRRIPVAMQGGGGGNITVHVNSATGDPAEIRRSAAAGARTALGIMGGARRYG